MAEVIHRPERLVVGVWGATGSGKTQTVRALLRDERLPPRLLVLDLNDDYVEGVDVELVAHSRSEVLAYLERVDSGRPFSVAYRPPTHASPVEEAGFLADVAWSLRDSVLVIDEAHRCCRRHEVDPHVVTVILQGRKRHVSVILASPRPSHVDVDLRSETRRESYLLWLDERADVETVREWKGAELAEAVRALPDLHGYRVARREVTRFTLRLRPRPLPPKLELEASAV